MADKLASSFSSKAAAPERQQAFLISVAIDTYEIQRTRTNPLACPASLEAIPRYYRGSEKHVADMAPAMF
jgi:hypothetical protein